MRHPEKLIDPVYDYLYTGVMNKTHGKAIRFMTNEQAYPWVESCGNVFKDIGFDDEEAANFLARTDLMLKIRSLIEERKITQTQAAKILKVRQPRIAEIMALKIQLFSIDTLLKYLSRLGTQVTFQYNQFDNTIETAKIASAQAEYNVPPKSVTS